MTDKGQPKILKQAAQSTVRRDLYAKSQVDHKKSPEFSPLAANGGPILLSQLVEFDWDETFIPVSLASINYPVLSFRSHATRTVADAGRNPIDAQTSHPEEKKFSTRK